ncbi:MAG: hypothetical protein O7H41_20845 [Planctomycetota bacterium]|nr:hypothetical protein [Planctomycetota bacterium]
MRKSRSGVMPDRTEEASREDGSGLTEEDLEILTTVPPMRTLKQWAWYMRRVKPIFRSGRMPVGRLENMNFALLIFLAMFTGQLHLLNDLDEEEDEW